MLLLLFIVKIMLGVFMDNLEIYVAFKGLPRHRKLILLKKAGVIDAFRLVSGKKPPAGESCPLLRLEDLESLLEESHPLEFVLNNHL